MIYFGMKHDIAFKNILTLTLETNINDLQNQVIDDKAAMGIYSSKIEKIFSRNELLNELKRLFDINNSNSLYKISDYHFIILYYLIENMVIIHNEIINENGEGLFEELALKYIDFDELTGIFFWDTDFLIDKDTYNNLFTEQKEYMGFSEATFGAIHSLKPHPEELKIVKINYPKDWHTPKIYKYGHNYPFYINKT